MRSVTNVKISEIYCTFYSDMHHCLCCRAAVPPFLGITTEIMDDSGKETNLHGIGLTIAIPVKIKEAALVILFCIRLILKHTVI